MAAFASMAPQPDLLPLLSDTSSTWTAASIAAQLTPPLLSTLPAQLSDLSPASVRLLLLALLQCRPAHLSTARDAIRGVVDECERSEDEWVRWLAGRLRDYQDDTQAQKVRGPSEHERDMASRLKRAVLGGDAQAAASAQQRELRAEQKDQDESMHADSASISSLSPTPTEPHGGAFLSHLPRYGHFLSPELLPSQLTTTDPLPSAASSTSKQSHLRIVSPHAAHFTVRRRFAFFDQQSSDDSALTEVEPGGATLADVTASPPTPPAPIAPPAVPKSTPPAAATATAPPLASTALSSPASTTSTPRRIALPSSVPHIHPRPLQSPSSAASPLALAASRLGTRPSLPSPSLTRQPSLTRPMSSSSLSGGKAGRGVVMLGLEEAGGLTDVKQRVREEKEKERRDKEEERRQEERRKKEEREREKREKEEEKRVEAEKRREEKEEKERQKRAEKEEKERKRLEWHRVREEKAREREEKKKKDEEERKQTDDEKAAESNSQQPTEGKEKLENEETVQRAAAELSNGGGEEEQKQPSQQSSSAEQSETEHEASADDGQHASEQQPPPRDELSHASVDVESSVPPARSLAQDAAAAAATAPYSEHKQQPEQQQGEAPTSDMSLLRGAPPQTLPAVAVASVGAVSEQVGDKVSSDKHKKRKAQRAEQTEAASAAQQLSEEGGKEGKKRKKAKTEAKEAGGEKEDVVAGEGEKADADKGGLVAAAGQAVGKRHRPSCKRKMT